MNIYLKLETSKMGMELSNQVETGYKISYYIFHAWDGKRLYNTPVYQTRFPIKYTCVT